MEVSYQAWPGMQDICPNEKPDCTDPDSFCNHCYSYCKYLYLTAKYNVPLLIIFPIMTLKMKDIAHTVF